MGAEKRLNLLFAHFSFILRLAGKIFIIFRNIVIGSCYFHLQFLEHYNQASRNFQNFSKVLGTFLFLFFPRPREFTNPRKASNECIYTTSRVQMNVSLRSTITKQSVNPTPAVIHLHVIACPPFNFPAIFNLFIVDTRGWSITTFLV
jgi:hypothetical protein